MPPVEVKKDIYWVGAVDWNTRDFHGYSTENGTTYNSYLALDDKVTLFDTVKAEWHRDHLQYIAGIIAPAKIDYIVVNHAEPDHSGSLSKLIDIVKPEKVFCSKMGKATLLEHYHREDWPYEVIGDGQEVRLGRRTVTFYETRMLHWPDSMVSYFRDEKLLISNDIFGQHWATTERFDDEVSTDELLRQTAKYYANIILPYSPRAQKLLATMRELELDIDMIAPDHGLIWRTDVAKIIESYGTWSRQETLRKAVIIYDTMWQSTEMMAKAILEGIVQQGVTAKLLSLKHVHRSDIMTDVLDAKAIVMGSPVLNNGMMPAMAEMLSYMKGLKPTGKIGGSFGSYGWSGESAKLIAGALTEMKFGIVEPAIRAKYVPNEQTLIECRELGDRIGAAVNDAVDD